MYATIEIVAIKRKETKVASTGDIYQLAHKFRDFDNKLCENVYFYRRSAVAATPAANYATRLATDWNTEVLTLMLPSFPTNFISYSVDVKNLMDDADQYSLSINRGGTRSIVAQENMPTFTNAVANFATDNGAVKKGRKSYAGLLELDNNAGVLVGAGAGLMANRTAAALLNVTGAVVAGWVFNPVVVKRIFDALTGTYRLPATIAEAVYGVITSGVVSNIISTMNSRKK